MERNLQKGFAILLILCLLASGVEGHDLTVTPDIKAKFADCVRMHPDQNLYVPSGQIIMGSGWGMVQGTHHPNSLSMYRLA